MSHVCYFEITYFVLVISKLRLITYKLFCNNYLIIIIRLQICLVNNDLALDVGTCQRWFARFSSGDFDLNDKDRPGRPIEANDSLL